MTVTLCKRKFHMELDAGNIHSEYLHVLSCKMLEIKLDQPEPVEVYAVFSVEGLDSLLAFQAYSEWASKAKGME